jgi:uncharacterized protein
MDLLEQINEDIKTAMKAKDKDRLAALRAVKAELLLLKTADGASDTIPEETCIKVLQKLVKQRKDSAEIFKTQGREDLYQEEMVAVPFIEAYLPQQMSEDELVVVLKDMIARSGATSAREMGKVMGLASKELAGKADNKTISQLLKQLLG